MFNLLKYLRGTVKHSLVSSMHFLQETSAQLLTTLICKRGMLFCRMCWYHKLTHEIFIFWQHAWKERLWFSLLKVHNPTSFHQITHLSTKALIFYQFWSVSPRSSDDHFSELSHLLSFPFLDLLLNYQMILVLENKLNI